MASVENMGEVDEINSKGEGDVVTNGEVNSDAEAPSPKISKSASEDCESSSESESLDKKKSVKEKENNEVISDNNDLEENKESIENENNSEVKDEVGKSIEDNSDSEEKTVDTDCAKSNEVNESLKKDSNKSPEISDDEQSLQTEQEVKSDKSSEEKSKPKLVEGSSKEVIEIHEIDDEDEEKVKENGASGVGKVVMKKELTEENDAGDTDGEGDVIIVESTPPKENGAGEKRKVDPEIIDLEIDSTPVKKQKIDTPVVTPRRSSRNINKQKSYVESDKEEEEDTDAPKKSIGRMDPVKGKCDSEESDIEEVLPEDPLAVVEKPPTKPSVTVKPINNSSTIVVKDTKKLVEIATKQSPLNVSAGKKEPTLVIIDTNSILSGRGPVPIGTKSSKPPPAPKPAPVQQPKSLPPQPQPKPQTLNVSQSNYNTVPLVALPAQGMYPPNMRATITPIPMNQPQSITVTKTPPVPQTAPQQPQPTPPPLPPLLPTLTDDMFVVEAPSFIVPYVYEKPPKSEFKEFIKEVEKKIKEDEKKKEEEDTKKDDSKEGSEKSKDSEDDEVSKDSIKNDEQKKSEEDQDKAKEKEQESKDSKKSDEPVKEDEPKIDLKPELETKKSHSYFDSPLGKFFIDIGMNLVQEFVQNDLLKQQKRKREREGGQNSETNKTIQSLMKNLEYSKENNSPFKMSMKKCEFCHFKTESALVLAHHLETPHMKNYVYKCNFCAYEVRSPHDILFHMEAEHTVRGRLERAPSFHQCSNCPFEDNQKGKLSRHLVACTRKFKPERNLEPPIDWEPPAKIPRVPKMRHQGLNATAAAYQAMSKNQQYQFLSKNPASTMNRGRGRPTLHGGANVKQSIIRPAPAGMVYKQTMSGGSVLVPTNYQFSGNQVFQQQQQQQQQLSQQSPSTAKKPLHQPSISITPLPRASTSTTSPAAQQPAIKPGDTSSGGKNSFVICEICDGYIKDLEQLRNHMQWIHKIKIHPKMIYNRPPLNCQKCQFRFFTDQGLERHLLGSHGLVTSSMQDAANKSKDAGRCPVCGRVYQWKLLNHVARDHNMTLKPAHLSYKCTVCTATFGMYKQFENHVYSAHSVVAKRSSDKKPSSVSSSNKSSDLMKPLKINDEITIIPQPNKSSNGPSTSKDDVSSKNADLESSSTASARAERLARRNANDADD